MFRSCYLAVLAAAGLALTATAQIDRESHELVGQLHLHQVTIAEVQPYVAQGYRLSNIEVVGNINFTMNCTLVRNTGVYAASWLFVYNKTRTELWNACSANNARIVDFERYLVANDAERYAAILFVNAGQQARSWHWFPQIPAGSILSTLAPYNDRPIDLETFVENGQRYYSVVSIHNTGADYKPWWVFTDTTSATFQNHIQQHGSRVYDIEAESLLPARSCGVLVRDSVRGKTLWGEFYSSGYHGHTDIGARIVDIAPTGLGNHAITVIDDFNPFRTFGIGCMGLNGLPYHSGEGTAILGSQLTYRTENLRNFAPTFMVYGLLSMALELDMMGAPGCYVRVNPISTQFLFSNGSGVATTTLNIPNDPALNGLPLQTQMVSSDPGINDLGMVTSNRLQTTIREW